MPPRRAARSNHYRVVALRGSVAFPGPDSTFTTQADLVPLTGGGQPAPPAGTAPTNTGSGAPVDTLAQIVQHGEGEVQKRPPAGVQDHR